MGIEKVVVDQRACKECGYCKIVCPMHVFEKGNTFNEKGYQAYVAERASACVGCMKCFYACPDFAITVNRE